MFIPIKNAESRKSVLSRDRATPGSSGIFRPSSSNSHLEVSGLTKHVAPLF